MLYFNINPPIGQEVTKTYRVGAEVGLIVLNKDEDVPDSYEKT